MKLFPFFFEDIHFLKVFYNSLTAKNHLLLSDSAILEEKLPL